MSRHQHYVAPESLPLFDGETITPALDTQRLAGLLERVHQALSNGAWWTLRELVTQCGGSEAGVSARIRDCRKRKFGGAIIERRRRGDPKVGLWEYRRVT